MRSENIQYYKDRLKYLFYKNTTGINKKSKTSMQSLLLQLEVKKLFPKKISAIEMFGMHGLWHTMDYINYVSNLDIFEINKSYHELSKSVLKKYPVQFYNLDSIKYIKETNNKYNFIVADIPYGGDFYDDNGLPVFFEYLIKISEYNSVIIFNCHSSKLKGYNSLTRLIKDKVRLREILDLFFVPRNNQMSYIALVIK
ncbi:MAG: hypothetical protein HY062_07820 [Bacteroidetes bacterium]|nr:hypothetical protein [Bacteroidota bacterium]